MEGESLHLKAITAAGAGPQLMIMFKNKSFCQAHAVLGFTREKNRLGGSPVGKVGTEAGKS